MIDLKPLLASRTILTNIAIGVIGVATAAGLLPDACNAQAVADNLGASVPTLLGSAITVLAVISSVFRAKATTVLT